jgi:hypothetical protein
MSLNQMDMNVVMYLKLRDLLIDKERKKKSKVNYSLMIWENKMEQ